MLKQKSKKCLIFDVEKHRYKKFISDISGQDIQEHKSEVKKLIGKIALWLGDISVGVPGGTHIHNELLVFNHELPELCDILKKQPAESRRLPCQPQF